jgi:hypothetical protein
MRGIMRGPNPEELLWDAGADVDRVGSEHFCAGLSPIATIDYLVWHVEEGSYGTVVISMTTSTSVMRGVYTRATASALGWAPTAAVLTGSRAKARALRIPPVAAAAAAAVRLASGPAARYVGRSPVPGSTTPVPGLFLAGQWTRNGPGINNVFASASDAATAVEAATRPG